MSMTLKRFTAIHVNGDFLIGVDTIQGAFGFLEAKKASKKKIFIWWKQARYEISCDDVHLFIDLVVIEISFDLYLSVSS